MVLTIRNRIYGFRVCQTWLAEKPFDVEDCDRAMFYWSKEDATVQGFRKDVSYSNIVDLEKPIEQIQKGFSETTRYEIKRAEKESIAFKESDYASFVPMFNKFIEIKKLKLPKMTKEIFNMQHNMLLCAYYDGKIIAGHYYALEDDLAILLFSGSAQRTGENKNIISYAARNLHFQAIKKAKDEGYRRFSFSSIGDDPKQPDREGKYKLSFGGEVTAKAYYTKDYSALLKGYEVIKKKFVRGSYG